VPAGDERAGLAGPRRRRKARNRLSLRLQARVAWTERTFWAPHRIGWWTGALFAVGSTLFLAPSLPGAAEVVSATAIAATYFAGSIFFTLAGYTQLLEVLNADRERGPRDAGLRWFGWEPGEVGFWASFVQSVGTVCFNVSTFAALLDPPDARTADLLVWSPDAYGSICFLVASALAVQEVSGPGRWWSPRRIEWQVAWLNMVGSVAFGASAVAAYVVQDTNELVNAALATSGTLVGAICFLAGAILLMPEAAVDEDHDWLDDRLAARGVTAPGGVA
jgi:hypothetical protein